MRTASVFYWQTGPFTATYRTGVWPHTHIQIHSIFHGKSLQYTDGVSLVVIFFFSFKIKSVKFTVKIGKY